MVRCELIRKTAGTKNAFDDGSKDGDAAATKRRIWTGGKV